MFTADEISRLISALERIANALEEANKSQND